MLKKLQCNFVKKIKRIRIKMKSNIYNQFQLEVIIKIIKTKYIVNSNQMTKLKQENFLGPKQIKTFKKKLCVS